MKIDNKIIEEKRLKNLNLRVKGCVFIGILGGIIVMLLILESVSQNRFIIAFEILSVFKFFIDIYLLYMVNSVMDTVVNTRNSNNRLSTKTSGPTFKSSSLVWFNIVVGFLFSNSLMISALSVLNVAMPKIYGNVYYFFALTFLEEVN